MRNAGLISFYIGVGIISSVVGEEGMWPFNRIRTEEIRKTYGTELTSDWIEHVQQSCLRVSLGGSASFVSSKGLVMTNHHVGDDAVYNVSTPEHDYVSEGFYAKNFEEELTCPNMYVDQLISMSDVTKEVGCDVTEAMSDAEKEKSRSAAMARIEEKAKKETGLHPEIVKLYGGARYHLYLYKRYTDIKLVMAPEKAIAFFGGDTENFEYPRYDLDVCFFRVYENGKPLTTDRYLKWSSEGPKEGEPLFVAGHPGKTERLFTAEHLAFLKERQIPLFLRYLTERKELLENFSQQSPECKRVAAQDLFSVLNSLKVFKGRATGLADSSLMEEKRAFDRSLYGNKEGSPQPALQKTLTRAGDLLKPFFLTSRMATNSRPYGWALTLVQLSAEREKPNDKRLKEYTEAKIPSLEMHLLSKEPVDAALEEAALADHLQRVQRDLGDSHPFVKEALGGKNPQERAKALMAGTTLTNVEVRSKLLSDPKALAGSTDPLIELAKRLDPYAREINLRWKEEVESVFDESYAKIAEALFAKRGEEVYPDATFTLRLSVGVLRGYQEGKTSIDPATTLAGAYECASAHGNKGFYELPSSWLNRESFLQKEVPFNFVTTHDIIGGNSGSPVINAKGEVVGLIFDGNMHSLVWDYAFSEEKGRAVSVHSAGILESLKSIYQADALVKELLEGGL